MSRTLERALDHALSDRRTSVDPAVSDLVSLAGNLSNAFDPEVPDSRRERALFLNAVSQRSRPWSIVRNLVTAAAGAALVIALGFAGRSAAPGDVLYPVRQVLGSVGLASTVDEEIEQKVAEARLLLEGAEENLADNPEDSLAAVFSAMFELGGAEALLADYDGPNQGELVSQVARLQAQALALLRAIDLDSAGIDIKGVGIGRDAGGPGLSSGQGRGPNSQSGENKGKGNNSGQGSENGNNDGNKGQDQGGHAGDGRGGTGSGDDNGDGEGAGADPSPSPSPSPTSGNGGPGNGQGNGQGHGQGGKPDEDGDGPGVQGGGNGGGGNDGTDGLDLPGKGNKPDKDDLDLDFDLSGRAVL